MSMFIFKNLRPALRQTVGCRVLELAAACFTPAKLPQMIPLRVDVDDAAARPNVQPQGRAAARLLTGPLANSRSEGEH